MFAPLFAAVTFALGVIVVAASSDLARYDADIETFEHPLNDAWLGMPVHRQDGNPVGYVSDVIMRSDGGIVYILVNRYAADAAGQTSTVKIPASHVKLLDTHVEARV